MPRMLAMVVAASMFVATHAASAQVRKRPAPAAGTVEKERYQPVTHIPFAEGETVEGGVARPGGDVIESRRASRHPSLLELRVDFRREMLKSAENI